VRFILVDELISLGGVGIRRIRFFVALSSVIDVVMIEANVVDLGIHQ
jgi:hypothetical protein